MLKEEKKALRAEMRSYLKAFDKSEKQQADERIFQKLIKHPWIQNADLILCYYSMPNEVDTLAFISEMLKQKKCIALPVCKSKGIMNFYLLETLSDVRPGAYGIPVPLKTNQPVNLYGKTVMIVPGLAFMPTGERLGQGGGYYDRFLRNHSLPGLVVHDDFRTIGICYDFMLRDKLPFELHDCRVDNVISN